MKEDIVSLYFVSDDVVELYDVAAQRVSKLAVSEVRDTLDSERVIVTYDSFLFYSSLRLSNRIVDLRLVIDSLLERGDLDLLYRQYHDGDCPSAKSVILYQMYEVYRDNGAFQFVRSKHDLYIQIIDRYADSAREGFITLDEGALRHRQGELQRELDHITDLASSYTGYRVNFSSQLDLEDLLFNKLEISYKKYTRYNYSTPFRMHSLSKLKDKGHGICYVFRARQLLAEIKSLNHIIDNKDSLHYAISQTMWKNIGVLRSVDNYDNVINSSFSPFVSKQGHTLFKFSLVEPELYTMFKWGLDISLSSHYESGGSLNSVISGLLGIREKDFSSFMEIAFYGKSKDTEDKVYLFDSKGYNYKYLFKKFLSIPSLASFFQRIDSYYKKSHFLKSFDDSPVFTLSSNNRVCYVALNTIGKLTPLENVYKVISSLDKDQFKLIHAYYDGFIFSSELKIDDLRDILRDALEQRAYPFRYRFTLEVLK